MLFNLPKGGAMKQKLGIKIISVLSSALLLLSFGVNTASATSAAGNLQNMSAAEAQILGRIFTPQELKMVDKISTESEIDNLILALENPATYVEKHNSSQLNSLFRATPNGCSYSPDQWGEANFKPSCDNHDICYSDSSNKNRLDCDNEFLSSLKAECDKAYNDPVGQGACKSIAATYYGAVRAAGGNFYKGKGENN